MTSRRFRTWSRLGQADLPLKGEMTSSGTHFSLDPWAVSSTYELPSRPSSARLARRLARGAMGGCAEPVVETAELLISELVSNAVRHASSSPVMRIDVDSGTVRVAVCDDSQLTPDVRHADLDAEGGRGLLLVEALATSWGWSRTEDGKQVWFTLNDVDAQKPVHCLAG
jgi:anti-sigma regulatory factor (Ser/Thr protein kinase)